MYPLCIATTLSISIDVAPRPRARYGLATHLLPFTPLSTHITKTIHMIPTHELRFTDTRRLASRSEDILIRRFIILCEESC